MKIKVNCPNCGINTDIQSDEEFDPTACPACGGDISDDFTEDEGDE